MTAPLLRLRQEVDDVEFFPQGGICLGLEDTLCSKFFLCLELSTVINHRFGGMLCVFAQPS